MIILRQRLFSDKKSETSEEKDTGSLETAVGIGSVLTGGRLVRKAHKKQWEKGEAADRTLVTYMRHENEALLDKLRNEATKQGTSIKTPEQSAKDLRKKLEERLDKGLKKIIKDDRERSGTVKRVGRGFEKGFKNIMEKGGPNYVPYIDTIHIDPSNPLNNSAATLAHELGHSKHYNKRDGKIVSKIAHKVPRAGSGLAAVGAGYASGYKAEKNKEEGKKVSTLNKLTPALVAAGTYAPILISEGAATKRGLKELKRLGASDNYLKESKKALGHAFGTYATKGALGNVVLGYGGREAGKIARKADRLSHKKKEKEDK